MFYLQSQWSWHYNLDIISCQLYQFSFLDLIYCCYQSFRSKSTRISGIDLSDLFIMHSVSTTSLTIILLSLLKAAGSVFSLSTSILSTCVFKWAKLYFDTKLDVLTLVAVAAFKSVPVAQIDRSNSTFRFLPEHIFFINPTYSLSFSHIICRFFSFYFF